MLQWIFLPSLQVSLQVNQVGTYFPTHNLWIVKGLKTSCLLAWREKPSDGERKKKKFELHVEQSDESTRLIQRRRCICGCRLLLFTLSSSIYWNFGQKFHFEDEKYSTLIKRTATVRRPVGCQQATLVHLVGQFQHQTEQHSEYRSTKPEILVHHRLTCIYTTLKSSYPPA